MLGPCNLLNEGAGGRAGHGRGSVLRFGAGFIPGNAPCARVMGALMGNDICYASLRGSYG